MAKIFGVHVPSEMKNHIKNGALDLWQEKEATTTTVNTATTTSGYVADMFGYASQGATVKNYSVQRSTSVPSTAQSGFRAQYSMLFTMLTGIVSFATSDLVRPCIYRMEGLDYAKLTDDKFTVGFWAFASSAGTYSVSIRNGAADRSYVTTVSVGSNTWEYKTITVPVDTSGTYSADNTLALSIDIGAVAGTTFQTSTLNQWQAGNFLTATTATNYMATTNATFRTTMFSMVEGALGYGPLDFQRQGKDIQQETSICQRYYEKTYNTGVAPAAVDSNGAVTYRHQATGNAQLLSFLFKVTKRIAPTITYYNPVTGASGSWRNLTAAGNVAVVDYVNAPTGVQSFTPNPGNATTLDAVIGHWVADARL